VITIKPKKKLKEAIGKNLIRHSRQEAFTILGNIYYGLEKYDSAVLYHKSALQIDSNYVDALVNLGIVYRITSDFAMAEECYNKAKRLNPKDPEVYASLGALYIYKGEPQLAIENLERSIALDPQIAITYANYSLALAMTGKYDKAEFELKKAVTLGYKNGETIKERIEELKKID
jgi:tetratricopeptide (TPR) repeat protein